ncbi:MAG: hypothetical protein QMC06_06040, partial [Gammaproteobacteria bacterium]
RACRFAINGLRRSTALESVLQYDRTDLLKFIGPQQDFRQSFNIIDFSMGSYQNQWSEPIDADMFEARKELASTMKDPARIGLIACEKNCCGFFYSV